MLKDPSSIDISQIGLRDLRSKIAIIPQDVRFLSISLQYHLLITFQSHYCSLELSDPT